MKDDKPRIHQEWDDTANESIKIIKADGSQWLYHPNGTKEQLDEDHPRFNHWAGK